MVGGGGFKQRESVLKERGINEDRGAKKAEKGEGQEWDGGH